MEKKRNILQIDLSTKDYFFKSFPEINKYIGGEPVSLFLLRELINTEPTSNYVSITTGPLCGVFPYTSKSVITSYFKGHYKEYVGGGKIGSFMSLSYLDSIEFYNSSPTPVYIELVGKDIRFINAEESFNIDSLGLSGRRTKIQFSNEILSDDYFSYGEKNEFFPQNNLLGLVYSPQGEFYIPDIDNYNEVRRKVLDKESELLVVKGTSPSCYGCPMGCALSKNMENLNVSVLPRSLISCAYAEPIYNDINLVFSCLQSLGFDYDHEFLEKFPGKIGDLNKSIKESIENYFKFSDSVNIK
ncbi:hypothetical protein COV24_04025 [candidate division WWE3 bacterium CG10_big_fil_rev_8_21_14_0_10_32_10]|uniref:Aldehyde ferredoxin oxidoreductase N-terminal domain-containing protein n=1 Tax=candidate division WWE3 bacterium CG10_big_fil_rev_8_21_14_0_10_32_10 TaxID=1975090 RepID=A0A2H0RAY0_UNCKA|nr:MAG: hypothetical protein COV24_04025 [candidate division WWE3 bacterium CG10_big_fil_rev_8_21_14_0_10_32_10]